MVTLTVLSLLMTALFHIFKTGLQAWRGGGQRLQSLRELRTGIDRLEREAERSSRAGTSALPNLLCLCSCRTEAGAYELKEGRPQWQRHVLVFIESGQLHWSETRSAGSDSPRALESLDLGSGQQPLEFYTRTPSPGFSQRRILCRAITSIRIQLNPQSVEVDLEGPWGEEDGSLRLHSFSAFRN